MIHNNLLQSKHITGYKIDELEEALRILERTGRCKNKRYRLIQEEITRREESIGLPFVGSTPRAKGFTEEEWERFAADWRQTCAMIRAYARGKRSRGKIKIFWKREKTTEDKD